MFGDAIYSEASLMYIAVLIVLYQSYKHGAFLRTLGMLTLMYLGFLFVIGAGASIIALFSNYAGYIIMFGIFAFIVYSA